LHWRAVIEDNSHNTAFSLFFIHETDLLPLKMARKDKLPDYGNTEKEDID
jgi:hypothetical protein